MRIKARAKINLTLYVLGRRPDGYHDLELIFQPVSLADELEIRENGEDRLKFSCSVPAFEGEQNLVCRGYAAMRERFPGAIPGLTVHLTKHIPAGAGMGGGSTDCSALLAWLNRRYSLGASREELIRTGAGLGADVPACLVPHATLGHGIGERLTDISTGLELPLLLIKPPLHFSTGEMYGKVDAISCDPAENRTAGMRAALEREDPRGVAENLYNVFEEAVPEQAQIRRLKERLVQAGALGSLMTGSGSMVYGIFESERSRDRAFRDLRDLEGCRLMGCQMVNRPELLCESED